MMVSKRNLFFQGFIFRFHVSFPGCKVDMFERQVKQSSLIHEHVYYLQFSSFHDEETPFGMFFSEFFVSSHTADASEIRRENHLLNL